MNRQLAELILKALNEGGTGLLEDEGRFRAYLKDLNEGIIYEHDLNRYIKMCDSQFLSYFCKSAGEDSDQINLACRESAAYLSQDAFFDPEKAREVSASVAFALKKYRGFPESDPFESENVRDAEEEKKRFEEEKKRLREEERKRQEEEERKKREEEARKALMRKKSSRRRRRFVLLLVLVALVFAGDWYARKNLGESIFTKPFIQKVTSGEIIGLLKKTVQKNSTENNGMVTTRGSQKETEKATQKVTERETEKATQKVTERETEKATPKMNEKETQQSEAASRKKGGMISSIASPKAQTQTEAKIETESQADEEELDYSNPAVIYEVQNALNSRSFDCGNPDGIAGKKTMVAISQYRKSVGLGESSEITKDLLDSLEISMTREDMTIHPVSMTADMDQMWVNDQSDSTRKNIVIYYENSEQTRGGLFKYYSDGNKLQYAYILGPMTVLGQNVIITDDTEEGQKKIELIKRGSSSGVQGDIHITCSDCEVDCDLNKDSFLSYRAYVIERVNSFAESSKRIRAAFN